MLCHSKTITFLKQIKHKKLNVYKWREEKKQLKLESLKKEEEEFLIYIKIEFILEKKIQKGSGAISKVIARLLENIGDVIGL